MKSMVRSMLIAGIAITLSAGMRVCANPLDQFSLESIAPITVESSKVPSNRGLLSRVQMSVRKLQAQFFMMWYAWSNKSASKSSVL